MNSLKYYEKKNHLVPTLRLRLAFLRCSVAAATVIYPMHAHSRVFNRVRAERKVGLTT